MDFQILIYARMRLMVAGMKYYRSNHPHCQYTFYWTLPLCQSRLASTTDIAGTVLWQSFPKIDIAASPLHWFTGGLQRTAGLRGKGSRGIGILQEAFSRTEVRSRGRTCASLRPLSSERPVLRGLTNAIPPMLSLGALRNPLQKLERMLIRGVCVGLKMRGSYSISCPIRSKLRS